MTTPTTQALEPDLPLNFCMLIDELILSWQAKGNERGQCERRIAARAALEAAIEADRNKRALYPAADVVRATDMLTPLEQMPGYTNPLIFGQYSVRDYHIAPSGEGPKAFEWQDKPHRLVYDLCRALLSLAQPKDEGNPYAWTMTGERRWQLTYDAEVAEAWRKNGATVVDLYTRPPAQEAGAMSDEEISELAKQFDGDGMPNHCRAVLSGTEIIDFARAFERRVLAAQGGKK